MRKVFDVENADLKKPLEELGGKSLGEALLTPTKIYVKPMLALFKKVAGQGLFLTSPAAASTKTFREAFQTDCGAKIDKASVKDTAYIRPA